MIFQPKLKARTWKPAQALLPPELWDLVLDEISNNKLLQTACVCRTFNEISIALIMRRNSINASLARGTIAIPPHALPALHLSCAPLGIHTLSCKFRWFDVLRGARLVREIVAKCPKLTNIRLEWDFDIFNIPPYGFLTVQRRMPTYPEVLLGALRDLLSIAAKRTAGPLVVVGDASVYTFDNADISRWTLRDFRRPPLRPRLFIRVLSKLRSLRKDPEVETPSGRPHFFAPAKGDERSAFSLDFIQTVHLQPMLFTAGRLQSCTLLTFDMTSLTLLPTGPVLSAAELSLLLPHIHLPSLYYLELHTTELDPEALGHFLVRHRRIRTFHMQCSPSEHGTTGDARMPFSHPVAHPSLAEISASDTPSLAHLLDTFGRSPDLYSISLNLTRDSPAHLAGLKSALRRIALRTRSTYLEVHLPAAFALTLAASPPDDDEIAALGAMHVVDVVDVVAATLDDATAVLTWVAKLPALRRFNMRNCSTIPFAPCSLGQAALMEAARAALPSAVFIYISPQGWS